MLPDHLRDWCVPWIMFRWLLDVLATCRAWARLLCLTITSQPRVAALPIGTRARELDLVEGEARVG